MTDKALRALARDLASLRTQLRALSSTPQLAYSSIEDGAVQSYDGETLGTIVGKLPDGTQGVLVTNGAPSPTPSPPILAAIPVGFTVTWDGKNFDDTDIQPLDWSRCEIHISTAGELFVPTENTLKGTFETPQGGTYTFVAGTDYDPTYDGLYAVRLVARNTSGKASFPSEARSANLGKVGELQIVPGSITAALLANDAVIASKISTGAVTTLKLAAEAVTAAKVAVGAIQPVHLDIPTISPVDGSLLPDAVTSDSIADDAVTAAKIAAAAIQPVHLDIPTISPVDGSLMPDAVTSSSIAAGAVTDLALAADAVTAAKIAFGAVTTEKLSIGSASDVAVLNASFEDLSAADPTKPASWDYDPLFIGGRWSTDDTEVYSGGRSVLLDVTADGEMMGILSAPIPVREGEAYVIEAVAKGNVPTIKGFYGSTLFTKSPTGTFFDADSIDYFNWHDTYDPVTGTQMGTGGPVTTEWDVYGGDRQGVVPAGTRYMRVALLLYNAGPDVDHEQLLEKIWVDLVRIRRVVNTAQIADDAVTAKQIAANAVTDIALASDAVTAAKVAAGAIQPVHLDIPTISPVDGSLTAGAVTSASIAANAVTTAKIAADAVTAAHIAAGAVGTSEIAALAVTAAQVADSAIATSKLAAGAVTAAKVGFAIGGGNIVRNSGFAVDSNSDGVPDFWNGGATRSTSVVKVGTASATATVASQTWQEVALTRGKWVFTGWAKRQNAVGLSGFNLDITAGNATAQGGSFYSFDDLAEGTNDWALSIVTLDVTSATATLRILLEAGYGGPFTGQIWWSGIQVEAGDVPTAWSPKADEILPGTITATEIADNSITTPKVVAGAITAGAIAAGAVTAGKIAADAVTANEIAAGAVTASELAAGAVVAGKVAANAITATEIAVGAVTAAAVAAGAITAEKLTVAALGDNLLANGSFIDGRQGYPATEAANWRDSSGGGGDFYREANAAYPGGYFGILYSPSGANKYGRAMSGWFPVSVGDTYALTGLLGKAGAGAVGAYVRIGFAGTDLGVDSVNEGADHVDILANSDLPSYQPVSSMLRLAGQFTAPSGANFARVTVYNFEPTAANYVCMAGLSVRRVTVSAQIADGAITANKIQANAVTAGKVAANAITANELAANAVTAGKVAANAITATELAANAVTAAKIAAGAITTEKLTIGSIGDSLVPNGSMEDLDASGTMPARWHRGYPNGDGNVGPTTNYASDTISQSGGRSFAIYGESANGKYALSDPIPVTPGQVLAIGMNYQASVATTNGVYLRPSFYTKPDPGSYGDGLIGDDSSVLENAAVPVANTWYSVLAQVTVPAGAKYMLLRPHMWFPNVDSWLRIDNVFVRPVVVSAVIADGAVTANKIVAGAVTAGKVAANAISATELSAGAVTAEKLSVGALGVNLVVNGSFEDTNSVAGSIIPGWMNNDPVVGAYPEASGFANNSGTWGMTLPGSSSIRSLAFPVSPGEVLAWDFWHKSTSDAAGGLYFRFVWQNDTATGGFDGSSMNLFDPVGNGAVSTTRQHPSGTVTVPAGFKYARIFIYNTGSTYIGIDDVQVRRPVVSAQIADGAITTPKLVAGAITAITIATGAVTAGKIAADAVTANEIAANAITASELAANAVTAGKIAANAVTAGTIAASAVTAGAIAAGSITGDRLVAGTVTANELAANSVTAVKIAARSITGGHIAADSISSNEIGANAITVAELAANAVTANAIAANAVTAVKIAAGAIVAGKIAADSITSAEIAASAITASELAANSVVAGKIAAGSITATEILARSITANEIAARSITANEILAGSITTNELNANAINGMTITGGTLQTAFSGRRIVIDSTTYDGVKLYTGSAYEQAPGRLYGQTVGNSGLTYLESPQVSGKRAYIGLSGDPSNGSSVGLNGDFLDVNTPSGIYLNNPVYMSNWANRPRATRLLSGSSTITVDSGNNFTITHNFGLDTAYAVTLASATGSQVGFVVTGRTATTFTASVKRLDGVSLNGVSLNILWSIIPY